MKILLPNFNVINSDLAINSDCWHDKKERRQK